MPNWFADLMGNCGPGASQCVADDEWLTQYGTIDQPFKRSPSTASKRPAPGLSLQRGRLEPSHAFRLTSKRPPTADHMGPVVVRYVTASVLREHGFEVFHTPTWNDLHCSVVYYEGGARFQPEADQVNPWPATMSDRFDGCFTEVRTYGEEVRAHEHG